MKERKTPSNRMLLITEAKKSLKEITVASLAIPKDHILVFAQSLASHTPMLIPDELTPLTPHINFGHYKLKKKQIQAIIDDEEQLYWMTF